MQRGMEGGREEEREGGSEGGKNSFHFPLYLGNKKNDLYWKTSQSHYDFLSGGSESQCYVFSLPWHIGRNHVL